MDRLSLSLMITVLERLDDGNGIIEYTTIEQWEPLKLKGLMFQEQQEFY